VVCDPRKAALLKEGNKNDRVDARKLAELLRTNQLKAVYHGEHGIRTLKELGRSYLTVSKEITRTMNRIKSLYRRWAIPCSGTTVYAPRHRGEWLAKIMEPGVRVRAQHLYQQLDNLQPLRLEARRERQRWYRWVRGKLQRNRERITVRGLNDVYEAFLTRCSRARCFSLICSIERVL